MQDRVTEKRLDARGAGRRHAGDENLVIGVVVAKLSH